MSIRFLSITLSVFIPERFSVTGGVTTWLFSKADGSFFETEGAWITSLFVLTCLYVHLYPSHMF